MLEYPYCMALILAASNPLQLCLQVPREHIGKPFVDGFRKHLLPHLLRIVERCLPCLGANSIHPLIGKRRRDLRLDLRRE